MAMHTGQMDKYAVEIVAIEEEAQTLEGSRQGLKVALIALMFAISVVWLFVVLVNDRALGVILMASGTWLIFGLFCHGYYRHDRASYDTMRKSLESRLGRIKDQIQRHFIYDSPQPRVDQKLMCELTSGDSPEAMIFGELLKHEFDFTVARKGRPTLKFAMVVPGRGEVGRVDFLTWEEATNRLRVEVAKKLKLGQIDAGLEQEISKVE